MTEYFPTPEELNELQETDVDVIQYPSGAIIALSPRALDNLLAVGGS